MDLDLSEQSDEVMVLTEIYGDKHFVFDKCDSKGKIDCDVELNGSKMKFGVRDDESKIVHLSKALEYIPSISLEFELPSNYPSTSMPSFSVYCMWLSSNQIDLLKKHLIGLWEENKGSVILFIWSTSLQNEALSLLGLEDQEEISMNSKDIPSKLFKAPIKWIRVLEEYDRSRKDEVFNQSMISCIICFMDKLGKNCIRFYGCDHAYCKICMKTYFETKILEGTESGLVCPSEGCAVEAVPTQVKELISEELYLDFEKGMIEMSLRDMSDVVRCPLAHCRVPTIIDLGSNSGECPACGFAFCSNCSASYHGLNPCKVPFAKQREVLEAYQGSDEMGRAKMEKIYGKKFLLDAENAILSHDLIKSTSVNCPHCSAAIQKSEGCNKMSCTKCSTPFCYLCGEKLSASNPYRHFSDVRSACANQLFDFDERDIGHEEDWFLYDEDDD